LLAGRYEGIDERLMDVEVDEEISVGDAVVSGGELPAMMDLSVPKVLLEGDHQAIKKWREKQSLGRTFQRRPGLIEKLDLNEEQKALLQEYIQEHQN